jgi:hypothetical protein
MASEKARELRALLTVAIQLRALAEASEALADIALFLTAAQTLEARARRLAFGEPIAVPANEKVNLVC